MADANRNRVWMLAGVVALAVAAAVAGWLAGRTISSPEDALVGVETPEPSLITVPVELRELASTVVIRGDVELEGSVDVELDSSVGAETGTTPVVTGTPVDVGDLVEAGTVLIEVGERPVIALPGVLPMFRSLGPGSVGDDVEQLEAALVDLDFDPGPVDRVYDEATEAAVGELYTQLGYTPAGITDEERQQLDAARDGLAAAEEGLRSARQVLTQVSAPLPESSRLQNQASLDRARAALELARASSVEANAQAAADVAAARAEALAAAAADETARARLAQAQAGTHPDTGLPPTPAELAVLVDDVTLAAADLEAADALVVSTTAVVDRVAREQAGFVADAETELRIAQALYNESTAAPDTSGQIAAVAAAQAQVDEAAAALADLEAATGVRLPRSDILFFEILPRRVQRLSVARGDIVSGPVMTISGADITISSSVSAADRPLLNVGDLAVVDDESLGISFEAEITEIATEPGGRASESRYFVALQPTGEPEGDVADLNLRVTIPIVSTGGEVLTVPLAALSAGGDGSVRVELETEPGVTRSVVVTTGLQTTGFVEITPVDDTIEPGDLVVVGR